MMKRTLKVIAIVIILSATRVDAQEAELNVIYGDHHLFTVETPDGWVNDLALAKQVGLVSFFYAMSDSGKPEKSYMYAQGYDKRSSKDNLAGFVRDDLEGFGKKYPEMKYDSIKIQPTEPVLNALMLSFVNLSDRYREEVIYLETPKTIIVLAFSAFTEQDYNDYVELFDRFGQSFTYRGNNPKPFLRYLNKQN